MARAAAFRNRITSAENFKSLRLTNQIHSPSSPCGDFLIDQTPSQVNVFAWKIIVILPFTARQVHQIHCTVPRHSFTEIMNPGESIHVCDQGHFLRMLPCVRAVSCPRKTCDPVVVFKSSVSL